MAGLLGWGEIVDIIYPDFSKVDSGSYDILIHNFGMILCVGILFIVLWHKFLLVPVAIVGGLFLYSWDQTLRPTHALCLIKLCPLQGGPALLHFFRQWHLTDTSSFDTKITNAPWIIHRFPCAPPALFRLIYSSRDAHALDSIYFLKITPSVGR